MYLGLVLFFITFVVLSLSKVLLAQLRKGEGARTCRPVNACCVTDRSPRTKITHGASGSTRWPWVCPWLAMAFGLFWLFWILFETVRLGVGGLSLGHLDDR
jgi:hypothetical protein